MKRSVYFLSAIAIIAASIFFVAFNSKPLPKKSSVVTSCVQQFRFTGSVGEENDPTKYVSYSGDIAAFCSSGTTKICGFCIQDASLVYTHDEVVTNDPNNLIPDSFEGKPKVDVSAGNTLDNDITSALTAPRSHSFTGTNVIIYLKD